MTPQGRILIIDSNPAARRVLHGDLLAAGFEVADAEHLGEAIAFCRIMDFDIVLMNIDPEANPVKACQALRSAIPQAALLALTQYDDPNRIAEMLEAGADQCLPKDLYVPELVARLRATLRWRKSSNQSTKAITIGDIRLEPEQRLVYRAGVPIHLTPKEFTLLHHLMAHAGLPIAHSSLLEAVWGVEHVGRVEYLRIFMRQLRTKLNDHINPQYLLTDSCIGYRFVEAEKAPSGNQHVGRAA